MIARRALVLSGLLPATAAAAEALHALSSGALEPALAAALGRWRSEGGGEVSVAYATAPGIAEQVAAGERPDLVLAPLSLVEQLGRAGELAAEPVALGTVGVGIAVREGAPAPAIRDEASFREHLLAADAVVFNRSSTGMHVERLLDRMGLAPALAPRTVRLPDGAGVLRRVAAGSGKEIAFAPTTEIRMFKDRGVRFVGPLPDGLQNRTAYAAGLLRGANGKSEGRRLLAFLGTAAARRAMGEAGVEWR